jgi:hypothetical protein
MFKKMSAKLGALTGLVEEHPSRTERQSPIPEWRQPAAEENCTQEFYKFVTRE